MMDAVVSVLTPLGVLAIVLAVIGSYTDLKARVIPNWLTVGALVIALIVRAMWFGPVSVGLAGAGIAFLVAMPLFLIRAVGAGDVKYLTAFGAVLGIGQMVPALLSVSIAAGLLALLSAVYQRRATMLVADTARLALFSVSMGFLGSRRMLHEPAEKGRSPIPLGVAIAAGCVLALFL